MLCSLESSGAFQIIILPSNVLPELFIGLKYTIQVYICQVGNRMCVSTSYYTDVLTFILLRQDMESKLSSQPSK